MLLTQSPPQATMECDHHPRAAGGSRAQQLPFMAQEPGQTAGGGWHNSYSLWEKFRILETAVESYREEVRAVLCMILLIYYW